MRLRNKPWAEPRLRESSLVISDPELYKGKWSEFFGQKVPLHVELGTGRGTFITTLAQMHPEHNYLGVEIKPEVLVMALAKAEAIAKQRNIGLLWLNINHILDAFGEHDVARLYINFCDPWPKLRHAKRRLTHKNFLDKYKQFLLPDGEIHFKTDNRALFEFSLEEFATNGFDVKNVSYDLHHSDFKGNVMTEYERKFAEKGMPIYRCEAVQRI